MNFSGVFLQKCISSPKYRFRECRWRGCHKMPDQSKPPLKLDQSCLKIFHRKLSLCQRTNLYWSGPLESHIRNFIFRRVGGPPWPPLIGEISSISQSCKSEAHILFHACFNNKGGYFRRIWSITCLKRKYLTQILLLKWSKIDVNQPKPVANIAL